MAGDLQSKGLCREQERREERQRLRADAGGALDPLDDEGSFDDGDPYTTNLYIGPTCVYRCGGVVNLACKTTLLSAHMRLLPSHEVSQS